MAPSLEGFCNSILRTYGSPDAVAYNIGALATDFVDFFGLSSYPHLLEMKLLLDQRREVASIQPGHLGGLSGLHYLDLKNKLNIEYEATDWLGRSEFSIMHECYEAIQETFEEMVPGYRARRDPTGLCMKPYADRFAGAVLMQPRVFAPAILETGLDICALRGFFPNRSYTSVAIRVGELLKPPVIDGDVDFLISIYDREADGKPRDWGFDCCPEDFHVGCMVRTSGIKLSKSRIRSNCRPCFLPRRLFPERGERPAPGFIIEEVIDRRRPIFYEKAMFDMLGVNHLALLARPVHWYGKLAKVILVGVHQKDSYLLHKQVEGLAQLEVRPAGYVS